jgi:hypothetical protein
VAQLRRLVAISAVALIAVTWRLWTPQSEFPQVPFLAALCGAPAWCDWVLLVGMGIGLCLAMIGGDARPLPRGGIALFAASLAGSCLLDQHRLQPWAYQFLIVAAIVTLVPSERGLRLVRLLVVSVYFWSAVSKIDAAFLESHGQLLLDGLLTGLRLDAGALTPQVRRLAAGMFPLGEMAVALLLLLPRTRSWGLAGSIAMHGVLLLALGPWGLDHRPAVLVWNAYFIAQNALLFRPRPATPCSAPERAIVRSMRSAATTLVALAVAMPALESLGWWDHWPSWAVYSSRPAVVSVYVHEANVPSLPPSLRPFIGPAAPLSEWRLVRLEGWSFHTLDCPLYPQERFRLAVARAIAARTGPREILVRVEGPPDRRTGRRDDVEVRGEPELQARCRSFWLNTEPRRIGSPD